ncbi:MAG: sialate O-acetylesterase [Massilibacteroides sp.]|nr:sialate O-acetylesterase [Massilibacteroides sp.]
MKKRKNLILMLLCVVGIFPLAAKVKLPAVLNDNMVLQRNAKVKLWGTTAPNKEVTITATWNAGSITTKADSKGRFSAEVSTSDAGGPYRILFDDGQPVVVKNILLGDVWVCSGQSNMEYPMKGYVGQPNRNSQSFIVKAKASTPIRMFTVQRQPASQLMDDCKGTWEQNTSAVVANFGAVAYYYGMNLQEVLSVPIGLINTSWGGTMIETWMSQERLQPFMKKSLSFPADASKIKNPNAYPSVLYKGMINPFKDVTIKGVIWYQGESNRTEYASYGALLNSFVDQLRSVFKNPQLPFYYAQIAPFGYETPFCGACLREQQLKCSTKLSHAGMAVLMDIGEEDCIHPRYKQEVGDRLAYLALADTYGRTGFDYRSPEYEQMKRIGNKVLLSFRYAENGLSTPTGKLTLFEVAGADKVFYPATAKIVNNRSKIEVYSDNVIEPVAVRYAFRNYVVGELFGNSGLPVSSFRTDDWPFAN